MSPNLNIDASITVLDLSNKLSLEGSDGKLLLQGTFIEQPWMTFITNASTNTFSPGVNTTAGINQWDMGDGSIINSNYIDHTYSSPGKKEVNLYLNTIPSKDNISGLNFNDDDIEGEIDLRELTHLTIINLGNNENITSIKIPASSNTEINQFRLESCNIIGSLDLSVYGGMYGQFYTNYNINLTSITLPDSSGTFSYIGMSNCGFSSLDFTPFTGAIAGLNINSNSNLTSVLFPEDSSSQLGLYTSSLSSFSGTLDVSSLRGLHQFICQNNYDMTDIILPEVINDMQVINVFRAGLEGTWDMSMLGTHFPGNTTGNLCPSLNGLIIPSASRAITRFDFSNCDLTGTLDVSGLTGLGGEFTVYGNDNLTKILNPTSSQTFTKYQVQDCDLTGTLDVSGLTGLGGHFSARDNSLNYILLPSSSQVFTYFLVDTCDLTGILDISGLTGLGGHMAFYQNSNLTGITFPTSSQSITNISGGRCDLSSLDFSSLSNLSGAMYCNTNSNLITVTLPTISNEFSAITFTDCSLNLTSVDAIYSKLNTFYSSNTPTKALTIGTAGGGNSPPTDGSTNSDIVNLETIFSNAGETLSIFIND